MLLNEDGFFVYDEIMCCDKEDYIEMVLENVDYMDVLLK